MGFNQKHLRNKNRDVGYDNIKGKNRPKLALVGGIILAIGILVINHGTHIMNLDIGFEGLIIFMAGFLTMLFSLRKEIRF
jgi:hypothetical protein